MRSGRFPVRQCRGAIALHRLRADGRTIAKGARLSAADIKALEGAGVETVLAAFPGAGDLAEAAAARAFAGLFTCAAISAEQPVNGRANLRSRRAGLLVVDENALERLNRLDEGLGIALLPPFSPVRKGQLIGTVKIIPFALPGALLGQARKIRGRAPPADVRPYRHREGVLVLSETEATRKLREKTARAVAARLEGLGGRLAETVTAPHEEGAVAAALKRLRLRKGAIVLMVGASATSDRNDVLPQALRRAGGRLGRYGIPVDPGNLLFTGTLGTAPVIGLPGCARSPLLNGVDWVLERTAAGIRMTNRDFARLGLGGLLKETAARPAPREEKKRPARRMKAAGLVLASGESRRFAGGNKLLARLDGKTVIEGTVAALARAGASPILVVTGFEGEKIRAALEGRKVRFVENPDWREGMAAAIRHGIAKLEGKAEAAVIALGDMPLVRPATVRALAQALDPAQGRLIAVPAWRGKRGNPVAWHREMFGALSRIEGDAGGKRVIAANPGAVAEVPVDDPGILSDLDTRAALDEAAKRA